MGILSAVVNSVRSTVTTIVYPMAVPIKIILSYPFPIVFPHHQTTDLKKENKWGNDKFVGNHFRIFGPSLWATETDPLPTYMKKHSHRFRGVIGIDIERCTGCRRCERVCPNKIIRMVPRTEEELVLRFPDLEGKKNQMNKKGIHPEIYFGRCLFCGYCGEELVNGCPYDSLHLTNLYDIAEVFDDNMIFTPEKLQHVVEKVGRGTQNWWTDEPAKPKPKKPRKVPAKAKDGSTPAKKAVVKKPPAEDKAVESKTVETEKNPEPSPSEKTE